jgi:hypothetical protein
METQAPYIVSASILEEAPRVIPHGLKTFALSIGGQIVAMDLSREHADLLAAGVEALQQLVEVHQHEAALAHMIETLRGENVYLRRRFEMLSTEARYWKNRFEGKEQETK